MPSTSPRDAVPTVVGSRTSTVAVEFEHFVVARGPALVRLAHGLLRDPQHAEDVVQDVLARALVRWEKLQRVDDLDAYVRRMVVNASTSFWRRAARREHAVEHDALPVRQVPDGTGTVSERDQMLALLRRLPTKQRAVLVLRHYECLPDAEIAELLRCTPVTVRSQAHRGLAKLRTMLDEDAVVVAEGAT